MPADRGPPLPRGGSRWTGGREGGEAESGDCRVLGGKAGLPGDVLGLLCASWNRGRFLKQRSYSVCEIQISGVGTSSAPQSWHENCFKLKTFEIQQMQEEAS